MTRKVLIVDYGLGNLFSIQQACAHCGIEASISHCHKELLEADGVILPGMGAFAVAMEALHRLDLVAPLKDYAASGRPLMGICLGLQLLMTESEEFGCHRGLDLIPGAVVRLNTPAKVPQIGWNSITPPEGEESWRDSILDGVSPGAYMYFVHSYYAIPANSEAILTASNYASVSFSSALRRGNLTAFQYHPERSGPIGLKIYKNFAVKVAGAKKHHA